MRPRLHRALLCLVLLAAAALPAICLAGPAGQGAVPIAAPAVPIAAPTVPIAAPTVSIAAPAPHSGLPWWAWIGLLFMTTFLIGIVAVLGGIGGGVLFIPIVGSFFPFHSDFVRCAGLLIALAGSLSAGPSLIRKNLANLRLSIPAALIASAASIFGAKLGLALPSNIVQIATAVLMTGIIILLLLAKKSAFPQVESTDALGRFLDLGGVFVDEATGKEVRWNIHRTLPGLAIFTFVGFMAGMLGLGAGWANVPVLNLLMGAPLKIAVATSNLVIAVSSTTAAWVYINKGALLPVVVIPAILGMMAGTRIGARLLQAVDSRVVRIVVIALMSVSTALSFAKGFGLMK